MFVASRNYRRLFFGETVNAAQGQGITRNDVPQQVEEDHGRDVMNVRLSARILTSSVICVVLFSRVKEDQFPCKVLTAKMICSSSGCVFVANDTSYSAIPCGRTGHRPLLSTAFFPESDDMTLEH